MKDYKIDKIDMPLDLAFYIVMYEDEDKIPLYKENYYIKIYSIGINEKGVSKSIKILYKDTRIATIYYTQLYEDKKIDIAFYVHILFFYPIILDTILKEMTKGFETLFYNVTYYNNYHIYCYRKFDLYNENIIGYNKKPNERIIHFTEDMEDYYEIR